MNGRTCISVVIMANERFSKEIFVIGSNKRKDECKVDCVWAEETMDWGDERKSNDSKLHLEYYKKYTKSQHTERQVQH